MNSINDSNAHVHLGNPPSKFKLMTIDDVREIPPPEWLIDGILGMNNFAVMYGASGHGKSFVALDIALSVASGTAWHGHPVRKKKVVYIAAEGVYGIRQRVEAWLKNAHLHDDVKNAFFIREAPQLLKDLELKQLKTALMEISDVGLIVVDTLARSFVGFDENSSNDMGRLVRALDDIRNASGAAVLLVHHTGKPAVGKARMERGSSALRGAADAMFEITFDKKSDTITFTCDKQKDADDCEEMTFKLDCFEVLPQRTSCVPISSGSQTTGERPAPSKTYMPTLQALANLGGMASSASWFEATGLKSERTFQQPSAPSCAQMGRAFGGHPARLSADSLGFCHCQTQCHFNS